MLLISINLYSAPPDSCLWAPDLTNVKETTAVLMLNFLKVDNFNRDSTLYVDTCGLEPSYYRDSEGNLSPFGGSQYRFEKRYYSKSIWELSISRSIFDTVGKDLNSLKYFTVDDIDSNNHEIYNSFQFVKSEYGNIKFWFSLDKELSIQGAWVENGFYTYIETENLVNSLEFEDYINELLPNTSCQFLSEISYTVSVKDVSKTNYTINVAQDFNSLLIESDELIKNIIVYSLEGVKLIEITNYRDHNTDIQINISHLQTGVYFVQINNTMHKFMVVR
jgi:hypothetical protein